MGALATEGSVLPEHDHHAHSNSSDGVKEPKLKFAIALTSVTLVGEIIGGWWTGSIEGPLRDLEASHCPACCYCSIRSRKGLKLLLLG